MVADKDSQRYSALPVAGSRPSRARKDSDVASDRPIVVLIDPKWNFDVHQVEGDNEDDSAKVASTIGNLSAFFAEAKVTEVEAGILRGRFDTFCTYDPKTSKEPFWTFDNFHQFNARYDVCKPSEEHHVFRAMDRRYNYRLDFYDLLTGCAAGSPTTPHILNSYTGFVRARYIFDFYNASGSGTLEYEELASLLFDSRRSEGREALTCLTKDFAQDLGDVDLVTLRVSGIAGHICDIRVSRRWTGLRVRREIARRVEIAAEAQQLFLEDCEFSQEECLTQHVEEGVSSVAISLVKCCLDIWPSLPAAASDEEVPGIERYVHITFEKFYKALVQEQLRGTSRLFRLHRSVLHTKRNPQKSTAAPLGTTSSTADGVRRSVVGGTKAAVGGA